MIRNLLPRSSSLREQLWKPAFLPSRFFSFSLPFSRKLDEIVDLELLAKEDDEHIRRVWEYRHKDSKTVATKTLTREEYELFDIRKSRGQFLAIPIFRDPLTTEESEPKQDYSQYFTLLLQIQDNSCLITSLEEFRRDASAANPYMAIYIFDELLDRGKDVALVRGELIHPQIVRDDVMLVLDLLKKFYCTDAFKWVDEFNNAPATFDFNSYVKFVADQSNY